MIQPQRLHHGVRLARQFLRAVQVDDDQIPAPPRLPKGRIVNVPGRGEMFLREAPGPAGSPTVVLLHGWTLSADLNWFSGGYRVASRHGPMIAPDLRGHGRGLRTAEPFTLEAAADDVASLIMHLELGPAVLVGYSLGGSVALLTRHRHPEAVAGLVLVSTGLQWRASPRERVLWKVLGGVEYVLRFGAPKGITDRYLRLATVEAPALKPLRGWLKAEARRGDAADIAAAARALSTFDARSFAGSLDVPAAVVVTKKDRLIRAVRQRELAQALPRAQSVDLEGAHNAWLVRPDRFAAAVDRALSMVATSGSLRCAEIRRRRDLS
jgi:pimeloyl-ACP methyl ester carboxylesterase